MLILCSPTIWSFNPLGGQEDTFMRFQAFVICKKVIKDNTHWVTFKRDPTTKRIDEAFQFV